MVAKQERGLYGDYQWIRTFQMMSCRCQKFILSILLPPVLNLKMPEGKAQEITLVDLGACRRHSSITGVPQMPSLMNDWPQSKFLAIFPPMTRFLQRFQDANRALHIN